MRPVICMITDRHRLAAADEDGLVARVAVAAAAGVDLIQIRERDLDGRALLRLVRRCVDAVASRSTRVLVNDRVDVAIAGRAHGVHLRGESMPAARIRALTPPGFVIGRSVHRLDEARQVAEQGGLDYLIFGPVFETVSKPGREPAGIDRLRDIAAMTAVPVLAIGGITASRAPTVAVTGAAGFAAIGMFAEGEAAVCREQIADATAMFDTTARLP